MKKPFQSLFGFSFLFLALMAEKSCTKQTNDGCIDSSKITKGVCIQVYEPVCGCNNKTYGNSCEAENAGVIKWTQGACPK